MKATLNAESGGGDAGIDVLTVGEERVLLAIRSLVSDFRERGLEIEMPCLEEALASAGGSIADASEGSESREFSMGAERFILRPTPDPMKGVEIIFLQAGP